MATRSNIQVEISDGKSLAIYAHWDGYPSYMGRMLLENYNTQEKALALVTPGDISSINKFCDKPEGHTFDNPVKGYTTYYGRDRGEEDCEAHEIDTFTISDIKQGQEWQYQFADGKWFVDHNTGKWTELTEQYILDTKD